MFCGPSATPWSPPPSSGKTSLSAPSGSRDPPRQPRSLGSPGVMLSSGSCTPQTVEAKTVSKLWTHLADSVWLRASGLVILGNLTIELVVNQRHCLSNSCEVSPTHKFINIFPNQPCTTICSNEWVTCGPQETCKNRSQMCKKKNVQTESKE